MFHQLILVNKDPVNTPYFSINGTNTTGVPATPLGWNRYYLDGSVVGLHDASGQVESRHLLKRNISFLFESGSWRGQIQGDEQSFSATGADFYSHAVTFLNRPTNPWGAQYGASQYGVIIAMYTFMFDYTYWANECPHFAYHGSNPSNPGSVPEYVLLHNQGQNGGTVDEFSRDLITLPPKK